MKKSVFSLFVAVFLFPNFVFGANIGFEENYVLPPSKLFIGNGYVAASQAIIAGNVTQDMSALAGNISMSGNIGKDALLFGGSVQSVAFVGEDLRIVSGKAVVTNTIGGDLFVIGGSVHTLPQADVNGEAFLVGVGILLEGNFANNVYLAGGNIEINGTIRGNIKIMSAGTVTFGNKAVVEGNLIYSSDTRAVLLPGALIKGETIQDYSSSVVAASTVTGYVSKLFGIGFLVRLGIMIVSALFFAMVFRRVSVFIVNDSVSDFWHKLLLGLIILIGTPLVMIIAAATIVGSLISLLLGLVYATALILAAVYSGVIFGNFFWVHILKKELPPVLTWQGTLLGAFSLHTLSLIPYFGAIILTVFLLVSLGSLGNLFYKQIFIARK